MFLNRGGTKAKGLVACLAASVRMDLGLMEGVVHAARLAHIRNAICSAGVGCKSGAALPYVIILSL